MVLNICNFIQRTEQVPIELDISAIEDYILLLLLCSLNRFLSYIIYRVTSLHTENPRLLLLKILPTNCFVHLLSDPCMRQ